MSQSKTDLSIKFICFMHCDIQICVTTALVLYHKFMVNKEFHNTVCAHTQNINNNYQGIIVVLLLCFCVRFSPFSPAPAMTTTCTTVISPLSIPFHFTTLSTSAIAAISCSTSSSSRWSHRNYFDIHRASRILLLSSSPPPLPLF